LAALPAGKKLRGKLFNGYALAHALFAQVTVGLIVIGTEFSHELEDRLKDKATRSLPILCRVKLFNQLLPAQVFIYREEHGGKQTVRPHWLH
jgi:hypothetical protein